jgi:hypothetical protein
VNDDDDDQRDEAMIMQQQQGVDDVRYFLPCLLCFDIATLSARS